jgi:uncharacterized protein (DUF697 family)
MRTSVKKLPKAIRSTKGEAQAKSAQSGTSGENVPASVPKWWPKAPAPAMSSEADKEDASGAASPPPAASVAKQAAAPVAKQADASAGKRAAASARKQAAVPASPPQDATAAWRRALAYRMVDRYATFSGGVGIIPLPVANVAGVTAINIRMIQTLCNLYGVAFSKDRARAVLLGLAGGAAPAGLAAATSSMLPFLMPATTIIALAVSSAAAVTCTRRIGQTFIEHFEDGGGI